MNPPSPTPPNCQAGGGYRYPGALPFGDSEVDRLRFFGREQEAQALLHQLLGTNLLVLFSKSGFGKSSLLNAGLFHPLRERGFLPVPVRLSLDSNGKPPVTVIAEAVSRASQEEGVECVDETHDAGLWEYLKTLVLWKKDRVVTPVLVFDQFEELFTIQSEQFRNALAADLGEVTSSRLPERLRARQRAFENLPFSEEPPAVKIVLSLREDHLGELQDLAPDVPQIFQSRFRLAGLGEADARRAIEEPARLRVEAPPFATAAFAFSSEALSEILRAARAADGLSEPFLVQMLCRHIEDIVEQQQKAGTAELTVTPSLYGGEAGLRQVTHRFYERALEALPQGRARSNARRMVEDEEGLLTAGGRRRSALAEDLIDRFGVTTQQLTLLENTRLLRREPRLGAAYYELSHDRLAETIYQRRRSRMPARARRRLRAVAATVLGICLTVVVGSGLMVRRENVLRNIAEQRTFEADIASKQAEKQRQRALLSLKEIEREKLRAEQVSSQFETLLTNVENRFVSFMVFDLRDRLQGTEQRRLVWEAAEYVDQYFRSLPLTNATDSVLRYRATALHSLGDARLAKSDKPRAMESFREALKLSQELSERNPTNADGQVTLAVCHARLGDALQLTARYEEALEQLSQALVIRQNRAREVPTNAWVVLAPFSIHADMADVYGSMDNPDRAKNSLIKAEKVIEGAEAAKQEDDALDDLVATPRWRLAKKYLDLGYADEAKANARKAEECWRKVLAANPTNKLCEAMLNLHDSEESEGNRVLLGKQLREGSDSLANGDLPAASASLLAAMEIAYHLSFLSSPEPMDQYRRALAYEKLGEFYRTDNRPIECQRQMKLALREYEVVAARWPTNATFLAGPFSARQTLVLAYSDLHDTPNALGALRLAERELDELESKSNPVPDLLEHVVKARKNLAVLYGSLGYATAALSNYRKEQNGLVRLTANAEALTQTHVDLFLSELTLGDKLVASGDLRESLASFQAALDMANRFAKNSPDSAELQKLVALAHEKIGNVRRQNSELDQALLELRLALSTYELLANQRSNDLEYVRLPCLVHANIAMALLAQGKTNEAANALASAERALERIEPLSRFSEQALAEVAVRRGVLARDYLDMGRIGEALRNSRKARDCQERLAGLHRSNTDCQNMLAAALTGLGRILALSSEKAEAMTLLQSAMDMCQRISQENPRSDYLDNLAQTSLLNGQFQGAKNAAEASLKLNPDSIEAQLALAHACMFTGEKAKAISLHSDFRAKTLGEDRSWVKAVQDDFALFRKLDMQHPQMGEIEQLIGLRPK